MRIYPFFFFVISTSITYSQEIVDSLKTGDVSPEFTLIEDLEDVAAKYISWEEFWIDIDFEVKKYLYENTIYPKEAQSNKITGCIPIIVRIGKDFNLEYGVSLEYVPGTNNQERVKMSKRLNGKLEILAICSKREYL